MVIEIISRGFECNLTSWFAISKNVCAWGGERRMQGGDNEGVGGLMHSGRLLVLVLWSMH